MTRASFPKLKISNSKMKPIIPREVLWKERISLDDIMEGPIFKVLHEAFFYFEKEPMLFPMDELAILNEVGYQVTWLCHESRYGLDPDMEQFTREVFAHTGLKDHAMTVISLVYAVVRLVNFPPLDISKYTMRELSKLHKESWCRRYVDTLVRRVLKDGFLFEEKFLPYQSDFAPEFPMAKEEVLNEVNDCYGCAEPAFEEQRDNTRRFTLDQIVSYAEKNLSLDKSVHIQNLLFNLLVADGTREELEKVASIPTNIIKRDKPDSTHKEIVLQKHVVTEIHKVEAGGTGINNEIKRD